MNVEQIQQALVGDWASLATEVRPSAGKNADGSLKPFYLERANSSTPAATASS